MITRKNLAKMIDHTILKADTKKADVLRLCSEAKEYGFGAVCVNTYFTELVSNELKGTDIKTCVVVGFPLGACITHAKVTETKKAIKQGANEIDMVINISALKDNDLEYFENDIHAMVKTVKGNASLKVIIETCYLTKEEKITACELSKKAGADYVKTSTGFGSAGATVEDIALMRKIIGNEMGIKASGGIRSLDDALAMIEAGATRIGASSGIKIIKEYDERVK